MTRRILWPPFLRRQKPIDPSMIYIVVCWLVLLLLIILVDVFGGGGGCEGGRRNCSRSKCISHPPAGGTTPTTTTLITTKPVTRVVIDDLLTRMSEYDPANLPGWCSRKRKIPLDLLSAHPSHLVAFLCSKEKELIIIRKNEPREESTIRPYEGLVLKDIDYPQFELVVNRGNQSFDLRMFFYYCIINFDRRHCEEFTKARPVAETTGRWNDHNDCPSRYTLNDIVDICYADDDSGAGNFTHGFLRKTHFASRLEIASFLNVVDYWF